MLSHVRPFPEFFCNTAGNRRINRPNPQLIKGQSDETDSIKEGTVFCPSGAMISSKTGRQTIAPFLKPKNKDEARRSEI